MIIYPAIDLREGRCVRLRQGDPAQETVFGVNPAEIGQHWASLGAEWLHVVNLDGALGATAEQLQWLHGAPNVKVKKPGEQASLSGTERLNGSLPINLQRLREIRGAVNIPIQFGGGLRTLDDMRLAFELGADRVVLGTVAVLNPALLDDALKHWGPDRLVVSVDAREGKVATHGWQKLSGLDVIDLGHRLAAQGVKRVLYTDVDRDGMMSGVDLELTARLGDLTGLKVIASGGVAGIKDIEEVKEREHFNIDGVIVGQSLYTGHLDLGRAIEVARQPLSHRSAGIIPVRNEDDEPRFLLLYNCFLDQWQFPRGTVRKGENEVAAALTQFLEETGLHVKTLHERCKTTLNYTCFIRSYDIESTIVYYMGEVTPGDVQLSDHNHCEVAWATYQEAWELLANTAPEQLPALDAAQRWMTSEQGASC